MFSRTMLSLTCALAASAAVFAAAPPVAAPTKTLPAPVASTASSTAVAPVATDCGGSHAIDRCLVGKWEMTVDGALEYMRSKLHGAKISIKSQVGNTMVLNADGTFATGRVQTTATADSNKVHVESTSSGQASGRWSAAAGKVNYCATSLDHQSTSTVTIGGKKTVLAPTQAKGPSVATETYTCSGDKLVQVMQVGSTGSMTSEFKRIP